MKKSKVPASFGSNVKTHRLKNNVGGVVQNKAETFLDISQAVDIVNMHQTNEGSWSADFAGYKLVNQDGIPYESGAKINGLVWFTDSTLTDHLFQAINTKLTEVTPSTGVIADIDPAAGYSLTKNVSFASLNNKLFSCDGVMAIPRKWDGTTASNAGGWPFTDGINNFSTPQFMEIHQDRLLTAGFAGFPNHIILSDLGDAESCTQPATVATDGYINQVGIGDGQHITGAKSFFIPGTNKSVSIIFKNRSLYALIGSSPIEADADHFQIVKINSNYGTFNNRCCVQVGSDILFLNQSGVYSYTGSTNSGTLQPLGINSDLVKRTLSTLNTGSLDQCWSIHLPSRREVWFAIPTGASTVVNTILVYKYPSPADPQTTPKWSYRTSAGVFTPACGVNFEGDFYVGLYNGKLGLMFASSLYETTGIPWRYELPYWDAGNEKQTKRFINGDAHFKVRSTQEVLLETRWKGGNNNNYFPNTLEVDTTVDGAIYGTAIYGVGHYSAQEEVKIPYYAPGNGLRLKHILSGTTNLTGPEFLGLTPVMEYGAISQDWN